MDNYKYKLKQFKKEQKQKNELDRLLIKFIMKKAARQALNKYKIDRQKELKQIKKIPQTVSFRSYFKPTGSDYMNSISEQYNSYSRPKESFHGTERDTISISEINNHNHDCIICMESMNFSVIVCSRCLYALHEKCYDCQISKHCPNCMSTECYYVEKLE